MVKLIFAMHLLRLVSAGGCLPPSKRAGCGHLSGFGQRPAYLRALNDMQRPQMYAEMRQRLQRESYPNSDEGGVLSIRVQHTCPQVGDVRSVAQLRHFSGLPTVDRDRAVLAIEVDEQMVGSLKLG